MCEKIAIQLKDKESRGRLSGLDLNYIVGYLGNLGKLFVTLTSNSLICQVGKKKPLSLLWGLNEIMSTYPSDGCLEFS